MLFHSKLFLNIYVLPDPLSLEEENILWQQLSYGSKEAREKLIRHNIRFVIFKVVKDFKIFNYDMEEMISVGIIGLIKAVDTFSLSKQTKFSTYAARCIDNEILMYLRNLKKHQGVVSIDRVINSNQNYSDIELKETLSDDIDIAEEYEKEERCKILRKLVESLPDCDKEIIMLYFGFYGDITYTQDEIAKKLHINQSRVSRILSKNLKKLGELLETTSLRELHIKTDVNDELGFFRKTIAESNNIDKDDYIKLLELLKTPIYIHSTLTVKELIIISLKLGYINGKCFSTKVIADFLSIEETEVIDILNKANQSYQESSLLDAIVEPVVNSKDKKRVLSN